MLSEGERILAQERQERSIPGKPREAAELESELRKERKNSVSLLVDESKWVITFKTTVPSSHLMRAFNQRY